MGITARPWKPAERALFDKLERESEERKDQRQEKKVRRRDDEYGDDD